jgi:hypothetical protein
MDANTIPAGPVNVALVVDAAAVGNAGICAPSASDPTVPEGPAAGLCFVPINQDNSPDGWHFAQGAQKRTVIACPPPFATPSGAVRSSALR